MHPLPSRGFVREVARLHPVARVIREIADDRARFIGVSTLDRACPFTGGGVGASGRGDTGLRRGASRVARVHLRVRGRGGRAGVDAGAAGSQATATKVIGTNNFFMMISRQPTGPSSA